MSNPNEHVVESLQATDALSCARLTAVEIVTSRIILMSPSGVVGGSFEIDNEGVPRLEIQDRQGVSRISMAVFENGNADICLIDDSGQDALLMRVEGETGRPQLVAYDAGGAQRLSMGLTPEGDPALILSDGHAPRLQVNLSDGLPSVSHLNEKGEVICVCRQVENGSMDISRFDEGED